MAEATRPIPPRASSLALLALLLSGVFWGLGFPLGKLGMREMAPAHMVLLRFAAAAIAATPFALVRPEARALFRSPWMLLAGVLYGIAFLVQFEGLARTSVALAALLIGAMPALIAICGWALGERIPRAAWAGVAAATVGAAVIAGKPGEAGTPLGVALSLGALLIFLGWLVVLRRTPTPRDPMAAPAVTILIATATALPVVLVMHGAPPLDVSAGAWAGIVGQGVLSTLLATACWQYGLVRVGSATAGVFVNIEPLMGAALGVLLFGDRLTWGLWLGGGLILIGSLVVVLAERKAPPTDLARTPPTPA